MSRSTGAPAIHYAWVVLGMSFVAMVFAQGLRTAFGALVPPWEAEFGIGRAAVGTLSGLSYLAYGFGQRWPGAWPTASGRGA
jgi:hypothetical protein